MSELPGPDRPDDVPEVAPLRGRARTLVLVAGVVVLAQALALLALTALELASVDSARVGLGASTAVFLGALGLLLLLALARLLGGHGWPRGFLVFAQLLCLALSTNFRGDAAWITPTLAGGACVALVCLLSPPVTQALGRHDPV